MARLFAVGLLFVIAWAGVEYLSLPSTASLVQNTPNQSSFMRERLDQAATAGIVLKIRHTYVPLSRISQNVLNAVVITEDPRFWSHHGIDWEATKEALHEDWAARQFKRGASTITQQLARNLFLSDERSVVRKLKEWVLAKRLEADLSKGRILELYLNFAEWGDGVFGIEAASQTYFGKNADSLGPAEAVVLTAMLPLPRKRFISRPSRHFLRHAREIATKMVDANEADASIYTQVNAIFGLRVSPRAISTEDVSE